MENQLNQMALLINQNGFVGNNHGLFNGNTGICIFFYHLSRANNLPDYEKIADDLLDKVFSSLNLSVSTDFENGLAGIGWGVEYLIQNGFAEGNTDEILEEVDNKVFRSLNEDNFANFEITNGLNGYLFYLINRLKDESKKQSMAHRINRELLILVINKIDEMVTTQFFTIVKDVNYDLFWRFPVMLFGLTEAFKLNIYNEKIRCIVKQWLPNLEAHIPSMHINRLYLATVLTQINAIIPDKRLEKQIQILLFATDFEVLKTEVDPHALNIRFGWTGFVWLMQQASIIIPKTWPNYLLISPTANEIKIKYSQNLGNMVANTFEKNPVLFGLGNGIAGIGLLELLWPEELKHQNFAQKKHYEEIS